MNNFPFGIIFSCPKGHAKKQCPLEAIRKMEIKERLEYVFNLTPSEQFYLESYHKKCSISRIDE